MLGPFLEVGYRYPGMVNYGRYVLCFLHRPGGAKDSLQHNAKPKASKARSNHDSAACLPESEKSEWQRPKLLTPVEERGFQQVAATQSPVSNHITAMSDSPIDTRSILAFITASGLWTAARWQRSQLARLKSFIPLRKLSGTKPVRRCST